MELTAARSREELRQKLGRLESWVERSRPFLVALVNLNAHVHDGVRREDARRIELSERELLEIGVLLAELKTTASKGDSVT
jgi:hypothetical protein